jgi:hypothetical protein
LLVRLPELALIVVAPTETPLAKPCVPALLLMVANAELDDLHTTLAVMSCVVLLLYVPVAVNCWLNPAATAAFAGVTAIEVNPTTDRDANPTVVPSFAEIAVVPTDELLARPRLPATLLIVATAPLEDDQVTELVRSVLVWSLLRPVAVNCCWLPK